MDPLRRRQMLWCMGQPAWSGSVSSSSTSRRRVTTPASRVAPASTLADRRAPLRAGASTSWSTAVSTAGPPQISGRAAPSVEEPLLT